MERNASCSTLVDVQKGAAAINGSSQQCRLMRHVTSAAASIFCSASPPNTCAAVLQKAKLAPGAGGSIARPLACRARAQRTYTTFSVVRRTCPS